VYQAGTLSGNPAAMAAGLAQLKMLQSGNAYEILEQNTAKLTQGLKEIIERVGVEARVVSITGMLSVFFSKLPVRDFASAQSSDTAVFAKVWKGLRDRGIYWPPSQFETAFLSTVHSSKDIDETLMAFEESLALGGF